MDNQEFFVLSEGKLEFLGWFPSIEAARAHVNHPFKRVLDSREMGELFESYLDAWQTLTKMMPNHVDRKGHWDSIMANCVQRLLRRWSLVGLMHEIARCVEDDPDSDGTPYAHPAYSRGEEAATALMVDRLQMVLDGRDTGAGVLGHPGLEKIRRHLLDNRKVAEAILHETRSLHKRLLDHDLITGEPLSSEADHAKEQPPEQP